MFFYFLFRSVSQRERTGKLEKPPWHHALGMLVRMRHHDVLLDVLNYNSTLTACAKGWQWHQAFGLLVEMRRIFLLDFISCSSAIIAFEKGGKWKRDVCQGKGNGEGTFEMVLM